MREWQSSGSDGGASTVLSTGVEVGWDRVGAVGAGDAAKPATQEALDWRTCLDVGAVTRVLSYRKKRVRFGDLAHETPVDQYVLCRPS